MYHDHSRALQDHFDSRRIADRLAEKLLRSEFSDEDRAFIAEQCFFFLATADAQGCPDCSYKGGAPGFVRVVAADTLAFPSYDGNGMFRSLGNIDSNPAVGLLFIDFQAAAGERPRPASSRRPAEGGFSGRAGRGACAGAADLSKLPALHPPHADGGAFAVRARRRGRRPSARVEAQPRVQGLSAQAGLTEDG
jgi:hypothetical protein